MPGIRTLTDAQIKALPDPGKQELKSSGATAVSLFDFWTHITLSGVSKENIIPIQGWFEETLPTFNAPDISLLRLDGDLYHSTMVCLKYLYHKCLPGACIIIDDWALPGCKNAVADFFENDLPKMEFITDKNSTVAYWYK